MFVAALIASLAMGCGTKGSGRAANESRAVGAFTAVEVRGVIDLDLTVGAGPSLELSGDHNLLPLVTTEVSGDRLIIATKEGVRPELPLVARVTAPGPVKEILGRGATTIRARDLTGPSVRVEISGAGRADLAGEVEAAELRLSGAGSIDAQRLQAKTVDADLSGAGRMKLGEPETLDADVSGAGHVEYGGDPKLTESVSGAGSITRR